MVRVRIHDSYPKPWLTMISAKPWPQRHSSSQELTPTQFPVFALFRPQQDDVDNNAAGRMKAVMQTTPWFVWLESVEEEEDDEED